MIIVKSGIDVSPFNQDSQHKLLPAFFTPNLWFYEFNFLNWWGDPQTIPEPNSEHLTPTRWENPDIDK